MEIDGSTENDAGKPLKMTIKRKMSGDNHANECPPATSSDTSILIPFGSSTRKRALKLVKMAKNDRFDYKAAINSSEEDGNVLANDAGNPRQDHQNIERRSPSPEIRAFRLPGFEEKLDIAGKNPRKPRKRSKKKEIRIDMIDEDQLGDDDHISRLPFDCLLRIFGNLKREDLLNVMLVNRRLNRMANCRSLYRGKSASFGCFSTTQIPNGYNFMLATNDKSVRKNSGLKTFSYKIRLTDTGETRKETTVLKKQNQYATRLLEPLHNLPVPAQFTKAMISALNKHAPPDVVFSRIRLDSNFLIELSSVLTLDNFCIEQSTCDPDSRDSFIKLIKTCGTINLTIIGCPQIHENGIIDAQFFSSMKNAELKNLRIMESWETCYIHKFYVSKSLISPIIHYKTLIHPSLTINVNSIGTVIMAYLNAHEAGVKPVYWNIGLDRIPSLKDIEDQFFGVYGFKHKQNNGLHCVLNKSKGFMALFHILPISVNEGNSHLYLLDIVFTYYRNSNTVPPLPYFRWHAAQSAAAAAEAARTGNNSRRISRSIRNPHPSHLEAIVGEYRPNLLKSLATRPPTNFFASHSTTQSIGRLMRFEREEIMRKRKTKIVVTKARKAPLMNLTRRALGIIKPRVSIFGKFQ